MSIQTARERRRSPFPLMAAVVTFALLAVLMPASAGGVPERGAPPSEAHAGSEAASACTTPRAIPADTQNLLNQADKFADMTRDSIAGRRQAAREQLVGRKFLKDDQLIDIPEANVLAPYAAKEASLQRARDALAAAREQYAKGEIDNDRLQRRAYELVASSLGITWQTLLHLVGNESVGLVDLIRADAHRFEQEARAAGKDREAVDRRAIAALAPRYLAAKELMTAYRRTLARIYWSLAYEADAQIIRPNDAHAFGKALFQKSMRQNMALREPGTDSALDFYVSFPGSDDRVILRMPNYPWLNGPEYQTIRWPNSPTLWKLSAVGVDPLDSFRPLEPRIRMLWSHDEGPEADDWVLETDPKRRVAPLRYRAGRTARLLVSAIGYPGGAFKSQELEITVANGAASGTGALNAPLTVGDSGVAVVNLPARQLLEATRSGVNRNLLEAQARIAIDGKSVPVLTSNRLHVLRQSLILFLPGVFGSEISVQSTSGPQLAFPSLSKNLIGAQPFLRLECGTDGQPIPGNHAAQLDLFRSYTLAGIGETVYDVENQPAVREPSEHPGILAGGKRLKHYLLQPWAYDWRLRLERSVDELYRTSRRPEGGSTTPPYRTPPSVRECISALKPDHPLLEEKVVLVGHSTGGLVARAALKRAGAGALFDRAFFINVPFWGAPKAYFVYATGDMGISIVSDELMRRVAPNMPIVYYLAPTEQYTGNVVTFGRTPVTRAAGQDVGAFMTRLVGEARALGRYPNGMAPWNPSLEASARAFHASITGEPGIGWDRCRVFWSSGTSPNTVGMVYTDSIKKLVKHFPEMGDGTVPRISQQADWPAACLIENPGRPLHVPSPNSPFAWGKIIDELCRAVE